MCKYADERMELQISDVHMREWMCRFQMCKYADERMGLQISDVRMRKMDVQISDVCR